MSGQLVVLLVALAIGIVVTIFVLGFVFAEVDRGAAGRWHELAAEDAADPALRRAALVKDAYLAGEFGPDELDWRILLALVPPPPDRTVRESTLAQKATHTTPWSAAAPLTCSIPWAASPAPCRFHELHSGSGYVGTVCECGHDMALHYDGGCNHCDAAYRSQFPRPQMQEIGEPEPLPTEPDPRLRPPRPSDAARSVRPPSRQSHG